MRSSTCALAAALVLWSSAAATAEPQDTRLLRRPAVSQDQVAFVHAGDLWIVGREGGQARRLTGTPGVETDPHFSPDGSRIAFTATAGGNTDVYVMPSAGGAPRRLTYHPGLDAVRGWTRDGSRVLFGSGRGTLPTPLKSSYLRLWTIGPDDGLPQMLPLPRAYTGAFSPDGGRIAYEEFQTEFEAREGQLQSAQWRHYRGGRAHPIRVMTLADNSEKVLPWDDSNDSDPMWIGDTIYFVSDRSFTANLFAYRLADGTLEQLTTHDDHDVMNASAGPNAIAYEQGGYVHLLDIASGESQHLHIQIDGDFPWAEPQTKDVSDMVRNAAPAPDGERVALEARGEIFVAAPGSEDWRNLTASPGVHDRQPAWSPAGDRLAWLSDASGEYRLMLGRPDDAAEARAIDLPRTAYYSTPIWSPDGRYLLLRDNHLALWLIESGTGLARKIDADTLHDPRRHIDPVWSGDSRWVAYSKNLPSHLRAVFLYSVDRRQTYQVTDAGVDAISPAFDRGGQYLYFLASTDYAHNIEWSGMNFLDRPVTRAVYAAALTPRTAAPGSPQATDAAVRPATRLDVEPETLDERIVPLDVPAADYVSLLAGPAGVLFYAEHEKSGVQRLLAPPGFSLHRYGVHDGEADEVLEGIDRYVVSADGTKLLYRRAPGDQWFIAATGDPGNALELDVDALRMRVEPRAEWANIFRETWRIQREHFYQPTMHGADWQAIYNRYEPLVSHVNHRADLGYLLAMLGGELSVGHSALAGAGDVPEDEPERIGMLGADFAIDSGRYRLARIFNGDPWDRGVQAPLAVPGLNVEEGDYLLEVEGANIAPPDNVYAAFAGTAGEPTELRIGPTPRRADSRLVTVVPIADEEPLRTHEDWTESNRRRVAELSDGRIGYVWLMNTGPHGYQAFNRYFFSQLDKDGIVIDVRYNQGGFLGDYIIDALTRPRFGYLAMRSGASATMPFTAIYGPKVMLINESAGSGGDALPYLFRLADVGPLVGTRTWGGLVGATEPPPDTIDGGGLSVPNAAFYDAGGRWLIENEGVAPDIEVENTPGAVLRGHDPQLERAVEEALKRLEDMPEGIPPRPEPADRVSRPVH